MLTCKLLMGMGVLRTLQNRRPVSTAPNHPIAPSRSAGPRPVYSVLLDISAHILPWKYENHFECVSGLLLPLND